MASCTTLRTPNFHWQHAMRETRPEGSVKARFSLDLSVLEGRGGYARVDLRRRIFETRFNGGFWHRQSLRLLDLVTRLEAGQLPAHAAAVSKAGRTFLLAGRSGAGKSTASGMAVEAGWHKLQDDLCFLEKGRLQEALDWSAPSHRRPVGGGDVAGLMILVQAREDRLRPLDRREAVSRMGPLWGPPAPLPMQDWLSRLERELSVLPVYELRFRKSPSFTRVLEGLPRRKCP
ncbi:MAG: hypothetical protein AB7F75_03800 [Planctomycetota bacterium]